jgi:Transposase DDE domain group 1
MPLKTKLGRITLQFDQPDTSSDGGLLLLKRIDEQTGLTARLGECMEDSRRSKSVDYSLTTMLSQRVYGIAMGYEDCVDFDWLKEDEAFKVCLGAQPAPQSTLSRFENARTRKELWAMSQVMLDLFIERFQDRPPKRITLDFDATDDPAHGQQEFEFYHGYYDCHCFLPLLAFASADEGPSELVAAILRPGNVHAGHGSAGLLFRLIERLRSAFPGVEILFRGDAGFALPAVYKVCESWDAFYLISLARNSRLAGLAEPHVKVVRLKAQDESGFAKQFFELSYAAKSWDHERRIVLKAERLQDKDNPRFVVTNMEGEPEDLYKLYCQRGDIENRIKELKLDCFSGRTSCHAFRANFFRLLLHAAAFWLLCRLKQALAQTEFATSTIGTIRLKILKIAARIARTTRRIWIKLPRSCPVQALWKLLMPDIVLA